MSTLSHLIRLKTHHGQPAQSGEITATPVSQALIINIGPVDWVWNRPLAVDVQRGDQSYRLPVIDPTRLILLALLALTTLITLFAFPRRR